MARTRRHDGPDRIRRPRRGARRTAVLGAALALCGTGVLAAGGGAGASTTPSGNVTVVGYSVVGPVYSALEAAFEKTPIGAHVTFTNAFGPSGTESKAVAAGLQADIVNFSDEYDMERLVSKKIVSANWDKNWYGGNVTDSLIVFGVAKGNPAHVTTWEDLTKGHKVRIFTPNPYSSGAAQWNILAALGSVARQGKSNAAQLNYLREFLADTVVQDTSAATELNDFLTDLPAHRNDVLIDYESDIYQAIENGDDFSYVIPPETILVQNPIAQTTNSPNPVAANDFLSYLLSNAGQRIFAGFGFRPVRPSITAKLRVTFPRPKKGSFSVDTFGTWDNIESNYFGVPNGIVTKIESSLGQTT